MSVAEKEDPSKERELSEGLRIFLSNILPSLLTAIVGGIVVAAIVPWMQHSYSVKQTINAKKLTFSLQPLKLTTIG